MKRKSLIVAVIAILSLIAGCSGGGSSGSGSKGASLTIANVGGATWTCGFNPFNPSVNGQSIGFVYETLVHVNTLQNAKQTPMIASAAKWSSDKETLTFTIRDGVKWNDGKPLTADDVAFTFNLLKKYKGLDLNAVWSSGLLSVKASGSTVTMKFKQPSEPYFYYIAGQTPIVPEHVWSTGEAAKDPVQFTDKKPVGSGPYTIDNCKPANIRYQANPNFWQQGKPVIKTVNYPSYTDNSPANLDLATGKAQWGGQYIPNVDRYYVDRDKENNHYWYPPVANVQIFLNLKKGPTADLAVRQALAYAIDKEQVSKIGVGGQLPASNQAGIVLPTFKDWYDQAAADKYGYQQDKAKVKSLLSKAGYSTSKPLKLTIISVSGYTDWEAELQEIKSQLQPLGITLDVQNIAGQTYNTKLYKGDFQLAYGSQTGGPLPYYELRQNLYSGNTAPLGENASSNYSRYSDKKTDALFNEYPGADDKRQHEIVDELQSVMLADVPTIPVLESVSWFQYNTKDFTGWPTKEDPYALPAPYAVPDLEQVLLHLKPKG
ncbi:ABC transporter substrate-binding protein [Microlunatus soli]|uniref:Peptide/nickel transport system substrate-binding protein n=1 Tax=Microlunatus soli TaxID=630515 RepID=A0A1H1ZPP0_9ACTN|nr:ABC transporter substrate-binding protein [Microlunatus soli]SDT35688.1 peptide/nickel transport system substrate-binding protein [Microlunatus soli]